MFSRAAFLFVASHHANLWFWKQFTTDDQPDFRASSCESSRKPMILKAIHNVLIYSCKPFCVASHHANLWFWKQFTTVSPMRLTSLMVASHHANLWFWKQFTTGINSSFTMNELRVITQTYDFESNSQLSTKDHRSYTRCESSRKPMILKAIHNYQRCDTKGGYGCESSRKPMILKAIHNSLAWHTAFLRCCESSRKPMILKAIHNFTSFPTCSGDVASHHANLWFWKQFTTDFLGSMGNISLRVITQTYDFESNSQQGAVFANQRCSCESSRKPMILKAIHNAGILLQCRQIVASHHANLWFWKQFTTQDIRTLKTDVLRVITQTYDFESNSQPRGSVCKPTL